MPTSVEDVTAFHKGRAELFREHAAAHELMLDVQGTRIGGVFDNSRIAQAIDNLIPSAGNTIEAMRLGAFDHLTKPSGRDDLIPPPKRLESMKGFFVSEAKW